VAADGLAALHALDGPPPRAILLDLSLPQVRGFRFLEVLRQRPALAGGPVLVLTALRFAEARDVARGGVAAFVTKPYDPGAIVRRLDRLLGGAGAAPPGAAHARPSPPPPRGGLGRRLRLAAGSGVSLPVGPRTPTAPSARNSSRLPERRGDPPASRRPATSAAGPGR